VVLAGRTLYLFVLLYLPALAAATIFLRRDRAKDLVRAGVSALAGLGLNGYSVFWIWFCSARVGRLIALIIPIASVACLAILLRDSVVRSQIWRLLFPIGLSGVFSLLVLCAGFAYGGLDRPYHTAWIRFSHPLPPDNAIPYVFAEAIWTEHIPKPMIGDWHSSDRPPLQSGLVLATWRYHSQDRKLSAAITGTLAQSTWIVGMWVFLTALEVQPLLIAFVLAACMSSGFVLVNTFFVWPKLLAAAFVMGAFTAFLRRAPVLSGICMALALLAHGGSIFAFIGAVPALLILRFRMPLRSVALLIATAVALYLPWLLYQKLYDPPGDRLIKMHLAGIEPLDPRPVGEVLISAYKSQTRQQIYANKMQNLDAAIGRNRYFRQTIAELFQGVRTRNWPRAFAAAHELREIWFFDFIPTLSSFSIGIPLLLLGVLPRFRTRNWRVASAIWLFIVVTDIIWCLLMFGPHTTLLHQGTYAMVLLAFAACCLSIWSVSVVLAMIVLALQSCLMFIVYGPLMTMPAGSHLQWSVLVTGIAALAVLVSLLYSVGRHHEV
jgi:hypothetical protein